MAAAQLERRKSKQSNDLVTKEVDQTEAVEEAFQKVALLEVRQSFSSKIFNAAFVHAFINCHLNDV